MKNIDWSNVEEPVQNNFPAKIVPGGYICKITKIEDIESKEYLKVYFDVSEGPSAGYAQSVEDSFGNWPFNCTTIRSYKDGALSFFKGFITSLEESNRRFKWDNANPKKAVGCEIGIIFAEEEYKANDGSVKISVKPRTICSIERIDSGEFTVPGCKKLDGSTKSASQTNGISDLKELVDDDEDLPF